MNESQNSSKARAYTLPRTVAWIGPKTSVSTVEAEKIIRLVDQCRRHHSQLPTQRKEVYCGTQNV